MRCPLSAIAGFAAGSTFTLALLSRCTLPTAHAGGTVDAGSVAEDRSVNHSGSRLQARVLNSGDGARILVGWYDAQLKLECAPQALGAEQRCLPVRLVFSNLFFRDSACTQRMVRCSAADPLAYAEILPTNDLFHLGAQLSGAGRFWMLDDQNKCIEGVPTDLSNYCELGESVSRDTFALLTPGLVE